MFRKKIHGAVKTAAALCVLATATGVLSFHALATGQAPKMLETKKDLHGDPLPSGAVIRLGTSRLRQSGLKPPYYELAGNIAFLPDSKTLFTAGAWSLRFWDTATGKKTGGIDLEKDPLPQKDTLAACALAPDGKSVAITTRYEGTIRLLDAATGKEIRRFEGHARGQGTRSVTRVDFSSDGKMLASVGVDGTIRLWAAHTGKAIRTMTPFDPVKRIPIGLQGDINPFVRFSPDGRMLASKDGANVRLWEVATGKEIRRLQESGGNGLVQGNPGPVAQAVRGTPTEVNFSADNKTIAVSFGGSAKAPSSIALWETLSGKEIRSIAFPNEKWTFPRPIGGSRDQMIAPALKGLVLSPDGKTLAVAVDTAPFTYESRGIHLYDWTTGKKTGHLVGHNGTMGSLAFSPDGKTLASLASDGTIRLWDPATARQISRGGEGNGVWVETVAYSPDGKTIASAGRDNTIVLWQADTGTFIRRIAGAPSRANPGILSNEKVWSLAFSPDDKTLASGSGDGSIYLWDPATGKEIRRLDGHKHWVRSIAFSPNGLALASGSQDKSVRLWDPATGKAIRQLDLHKDGVRSVAFSRDGTVLASGSEHTIRLCDPATGNVIPHKLGKAGFDVLSLALAPDGKTVALGGGHGSFETHVVDLATGKEIGRCPHKDAVWSVAFSPDGKYVASAGHDHKVNLMEVATGKLVAGFDAQQGPVFCVAFSPNSKRLASGGEDTTTLVWDIARLIRPAGPAIPANKKPPEQLNEEPAAETSPDATDQAPPDPTAKKSTSPTEKETANHAAKELEPWWANLSSDDPAKAYEAIAALVSVPQQAVPFLKEHLLQRLRQPPPADPQRLARWIGDLDSKDFPVRQKATDELAKLAEAAEAALRKALAQSPSLEAGRRLELLLQKIETPSGEVLRHLRAVQVLEYAGTPEAKQLLKSLARGPADAQLTREARASLQRLLKQTPSPAAAPNRE